MEKEFERNYNEVGKDVKAEVKDNDYYDNAREKAMQDYLADVGPISQYINEQMDQISKEKNSGIQK